MSNFGLFLRGHLEKEENSKPDAKFQVKTLAINTGELQNVLVECAPDYKVVKDKDGIVELPVKTSAKTWDNVAKRFNYTQVKLYVPKL